VSTVHQNVLLFVEIKLSLVKNVKTRMMFQKMDAQKAVKLKKDGTAHTHFLLFVLQFVETSLQLDLKNVIQAKTRLMLNVPLTVL